MIDQWRCHVCGDLRPDALIGVRTTDRSAAWGMPPGTVKENVRFCLDRPACAKGAETFTFLDARGTKR